MKRISSLVGLFLLLFGVSNASSPASFRQPHPLAWMHALPTGEMPGWNESYWVNLEYSWSNTWNAPHTMIDRRNGNTYEYFADFEQNSAILELGGAIFPRLGLSVELPFAWREGGTLDSFIDGFHVFISNRRFNRQFYDKDDYNYSVKTNGEEYFAGQKNIRGLSNVKTKIKLWLLQWMGSEKGSCPCGVSVSAQAKTPVQDTKFAGTTGRSDYYYLLHVGVPLFKSSAMWFTGAYSYLGENPAIKGWPVRRKYEMYELAFDIGITNQLGLMLVGRAESPFLERKHLIYDDPSSDPAVVERNRAASGWNSLVNWRGSNAIGLRYRPSSSSQINLLFAEDWGIGNYDATDELYSTGAPDANLILQTQFEF